MTLPEAVLAIAAGDRHDLREAEIENFGLAAIGEKNIRGLDVAMNDVFGMCGVQRVGGLNAGFQQSIKRQRPAGDAMLQRRALQQFHRDVTASLVFADFEDGADVRMAQRSGGARFAQEALERQLVLRNVVRQKLQRDHAPQLGVFGFVHNAHAAATKPFYNAILRDNLPDKRLGVCHSVHILDSAHRQVNASEREVLCEFPIPRLIESQPNSS